MAMRYLHDRQLSWANVTVTHFYDVGHYMWVMSSNQGKGDLGLTTSHLFFVLFTFHSQRSETMFNMRPLAFSIQDKKCFCLDTLYIYSFVKIDKLLLFDI